MLKSNFGRLGPLPKANGVYNSNEPDQAAALLPPVCSEGGEE